MTRRLGVGLVPHVTRLAPALTAGLVLQALDRAVHGAGPLSGAAAAADDWRAAHGGDADAAIRSAIEHHVRYAGAQGFLTNLGGLTTMAVALPANVAGLALIECRLAAAIAHLRGYDLADDRTRAAILACLLGEERVRSLVRSRVLPGPPLAVANAAVADHDLTVTIAGEVARDLVARVAGKRAAGAIARRIPVAGGLVGASADGFATWRIGRYVDRELFPRNRR